MYLIKIDEETNIKGLAISDQLLDGHVEVTIEEYENAQHHVKFNPETREFSEPIEIEEFEVITEHEKITKEVYQTTSLSADDNLINMDLLVAIDDKLNLILDHLGLNV